MSFTQDKSEEMSSTFVDYDYSSSWQQPPQDSCHEANEFGPSNHGKPAACAGYQTMGMENDDDEEDGLDHHHELDFWVNETHQDLAAFVDEIEKTLNDEVNHISKLEIDDEHEDDDEYEDLICLRKATPVIDYEAMEEGTYEQDEDMEFDDIPQKAIAYCDNLPMYDAMEVLLFVGPTLSVWGLGLLLSQWICPIEAVPQF